MPTKMDRRSSDNALKRYVRNAVVGYIVLLVGVGGTFAIGQHNDSTARERDRETGQAVVKTIVRSGNIVAVEGCNRDYRTTKKVRAILQAAQQGITRNYKNGLMTKAQFEQALDFYTKQLATLPLPDCRGATKILNSDPDKPQKHIIPLYPGKDG